MLPFILTGFLALAAAGPAAAAADDPRLPAPLYPNVIALADAGQPYAALDALIGELRGVDPVPIDALILRARLLARAGRFRESAQDWQAAADREPVIASFARGETIRAQLDADDLQAALDGLARFAGAPPAELLLRAARASRAAGMLTRAAALYRQARNGAGRSSAADQAALGLAATLEQAGTPREALDVLRELQLTFRQPAAYDEADAGARRLSAQLNGAGPLTEQDYDSIVDRLSSAAAFRRAVDALTEWQTKFPESPRTRHIEAAIVENLYSLRANADARARAELFLKAHPNSAEAASMFLTLFRLDVREGRNEDVERRGLAILREQVVGASLDQRLSAGRLLAEYLLSIGQASRAIGVYDQLDRITRTRSDRIDLLWRMAIAALRAGNRTSAITLLRGVLNLRPDSETNRAATYWLAYAQDADGSQAAARTLWSGLIDRYPYSYYGIRAATKFDVSPAAPALTFPGLTLRDLAMAHADYRAAALLAKAGLFLDAATYARRLNATFRRDDAVALLAARASDAAGDPSSTSTLMSAYFGQFLERPANGLPEDFWSLAYTPAYWAEVSTAAARHHVDPMLMIALARQESHFDRTARSPVGAIGLFQIMPTTAAELDPTFAIDRADDELVKVDIAAELAATLLEKNLAHFQGALGPTIASYNADIERVDVWWNAASGLPEELFVDAIPYRETRAYVRQVLANYAMYQRFSAPPASPGK